VSLVIHRIIINIKRIIQAGRMSFARLKIFTKCFTYLLSIPLQLGVGFLLNKQLVVPLQPNQQVIKNVCNFDHDKHDKT